MVAVQHKIHTSVSLTLPQNRAIENENQINWCDPQRGYTFVFLLEQWTNETVDKK